MSVGNKMDDYEFLIYLALCLSLVMASVCLILLFLIDGLSGVHFMLSLIAIAPFIIINKILDNI